MAARSISWNLWRCGIIVFVGSWTMASPRSTKRLTLSKWNGSQNDEQELTTTGIRRIDSSGTRLACWNCWIRKHRHLRHHRRRCHGRNMSSRGGRLPFHEKANEYFLLFLFALLQPQQQQKSSLLSICCLCKVLLLPTPFLLTLSTYYILLKDSEFPK